MKNAEPLVKLSGSKLFGCTNPKCHREIFQVSTLIERKPVVLCPECSELLKI